MAKRSHRDAFSARTPQENHVLDTAGPSIEHVFGLEKDADEHRGRVRRRVLSATPSMSSSTISDASGLYEVPLGAPSGAGTLRTRSPTDGMLASLNRYSSRLSHENVARLQSYRDFPDLRYRELAAKAGILSPPPAGEEAAPNSSEEQPSADEASDSTLAASPTAQLLNELDASHPESDGKSPKQCDLSSRR